MRILFTFLTFVFSFAAHASEPTYCDPQIFLKKETSIASGGLVRARSFQVGSVKLTGLGIGQSVATSVKSLAPAELESQKFCTLYVNSGNLEAEKWFNHSYVPNPAYPLDSMYYLWSGKTVDQEFMGMLDRNKEWLAVCARDGAYITLGCDGQRHRGPTAFGMLLAFSGCSSERASYIVNTLWGLNGVVESTRQRIIEEARQMGLQYPVSSQILRAAFEGL